MVSIDEKLVQREDVTIKKGGFVLITKGVHGGLYGKITAMRGGTLEVKLALGDQQVKVSEIEVKPVPRADYKAHARKGRAKGYSGDVDTGGGGGRSAEASSSSASTSKRKREGGSGREAKGSAPSSRGGGGGGGAPRSWINQHIRVKVVSESFGRGKYYLQKVNILDVVAPGVCNCEADNGKLLEGLKDRQLQTVIPKVGKTVLILSGGDKGRRAKVMERNSKKGEAVVQIMGEPGVDRYPYEDICEYTGPEYAEDW
jgi:hypothetical protein